MLTLLRRKMTEKFCKKCNCNPQGIKVNNDECLSCQQTKKKHPGAYLFTVDWAHPESNIVDTDHSEVPH